MNRNNKTKKMRKEKYTQVFCCLNKLTAFKIELISFIISFFCILITLILYYFIPWNYLLDFENQILLYIAYLYFSVLIVVSLLMFFRLKKIIYSKLYQFSILLIFISLFMSMLGLSFSTYSSVVIINTLTEVYSKNKINKNKKKQKLTLNKLFIIFVLLIESIINWVILIFLSLSEYLRIKLKLNSSYKKYCRAVDLEMNIKSVSENNNIDEKIKIEMIQELVNLGKNNQKVNKITNL